MEYVEIILSQLELCTNLLAYFLTYVSFCTLKIGEPVAHTTAVMQLSIKCVVSVCVT